MNKKIIFLGYIGTPLSKDSIAILYSSNNVKFERCVLFQDFVESLMLIIFTTYLGDDVTKGEDRSKHFEWCWEKNIDNFYAEGLDFGNTEELYNYFLEFVKEVFYNSKDKDGYIVDNVLKLWDHIFNYNSIKTRSDVDTFIELYKMFEKTL